MLSPCPFPSIARHFPSTLPPQNLKHSDFIASKLSDISGTAPAPRGGKAEHRAPPSRLCAPANARNPSSRHQTRQRSIFIPRLCFTTSPTGRFTTHSPVGYPNVHLLLGSQYSATSQARCRRSSQHASCKILISSTKGSNAGECCGSPFGIPPIPATSPHGQLSLHGG